MNRVLEVYHDLKVLNGHGNRSIVTAKPSFWGEIMAPKSVPYIRGVFQHLVTSENAYHRKDPAIGDNNTALEVVIIISAYNHSIS
jgi:hypothetical protein